MLTTVTYESALARYPELVAEVLTKRAKGSSKVKNLPVEDLDWYFSYSMIIETLRFDQMLAKIGQPPPPRKSVEDDLKDQISHVDGICLTAQSKTSARAFWTSASTITTAPQEIIDDFRARIIEEHKEVDRIDALTPEQRQAEISALLGSPELSGLICVSVPTPKKGC